jgi:phosphoribosyl 1,2-cyclic phosphate phosphodiesterase
MLLETEEQNLVIDCGPDFRQQMLRADVRRLDGILLTHEHNDHIIGLDDVRPFNFRSRSNMPIYAAPAVIAELQIRFSYVFAEKPYPGAPMIQLTPIQGLAPFPVGNLKVEPIQVYHGQLPVLGFRIGDFTYITDMKTMPEEELQKVQGTRILVVNALHHRPHHSHLNLEEALAFIERVRPERAYLTHVSHSMGLYAEVTKDLPAGVELAFDGLQLEI